ncbi:hypothetical protein [Actinomadura algeriensis]|uniref:Uncharacterized protein n=1 Tax=Actinomadura algeriensis TaxID=1679523 RepID=A0ABR9JR56_9ACTN|nr:hypothetical protein [Actinomadura algeriensis]MBE1532863.1 hypothetical protein [Actinomadura algeriensis]
MTDERKIRLFVIATITRRAKRTTRTHEFCIDWTDEGGPDAVQAAITELENRRGRPMDEAEFLSFLNVHPDELEGGRHTVAISVLAGDRRPYHRLLDIETGRTRQELLKAALEGLPEEARGGAVAYFWVGPTEIDMSD